MTLLESIKAFNKKDRVSFHIPGHKGGKGLNRDFKENAFRLDVTEFNETDDLQAPNGILKEAQSRAASVFGAEESFYLTNGSSIGLQGAILASCKRGDKLLVDRSCHKSVIAAITLNGIIPIFMMSSFNQKMGLYEGFSSQQIKEAMEKEPDIKGAIITCPTYYGICSDISGISSLLHKENKFLIVDEAHGAHFSFSEAFPKSAMVQGADICIQSAHKTLPVLGQSSLLHISKNSLIDKKTVKRCLNMIQTTSPSYLLMTSIDQGIISMEKSKKKITRLVKRVLELKANIRHLGVLDFADSRTLNKPQDIFRISVDFRRCAIDGLKATEILKERMGIYPEMSDFSYVVFVVTSSNTLEDLNKLEKALKYFSKDKKEILEEKILLIPQIHLEYLPYEAWNMEYEEIDADDIEGRVSADIVSVCPPGAAILIPGQRITCEDAEYLKKMGNRDKIRVLK